MVPPTAIVYDVARRMGDEEIGRPVMSLWWSGVAAGLSISFSLFAQSILYTHVPDVSCRHLVSSLGYSVGFLMLVLSRQQLFTENTLTVVLPVMARRSLGNVGPMARIWSIGLLANLLGTLFAALFCTFTPVLTSELRKGMLEISREIVGHGWSSMFFKGISVGFLIAAMVWIIPSANAAQFHVVTLMTYLIAAGQFSHIIAGSVKAFLLVLNGELAIWPMITAFMLAALIGNIVGRKGTFCILIAYAQVMKEI